MSPERPATDFRALGESCRDGVFVHDTRCITYVNPALVTVLGFYSSDDLTGRPLESIVYPDDLGKLQPPELRLAGSAQPAAELRCVARDGSLLAMEATGSPCEIGGRGGFVVVVRDVTATRDLEDALQRSHEELEVRIEQRTAELANTRATLQLEASGRGRAEVALQEREEQLHQALKMEAVGRLAGGIAHDFNNLLSVLLSYSHIVHLSLPADSPMQEPLREMKLAAERGAKLTHQLLAFSRRQVLEAKIVDPGEVVLGLDNMLRRIVGEDLQLRISRRPDLCKIRIDPNQLEQVLVNLVVNARDAMPNGGRLTIELANVSLDAEHARRHTDLTAGEYVMLAISDTGIGMDEMTMARIFEPFFTTKHGHKGTGLGLSIVYGIVKQSGGDVWVDSERGRGTTFKLYFPAAVGVGDSAPAPAPRALVSSGQQTVLVVEDAPSVLVLIGTILRQAGYDVLEARSARAALALSARHDGPIALLLTDVVMPQTSGPKLAVELQARHPEMRVMYISGYTDDTLQHHGVLSSSVPFLQKPFTPEALLHKMQELLAASRDAAGTL
jgi:two-component system, cell cycle sensor histidine kinase and response regulator CckA